MKITDYSIVVPVYNSEDTLEELFERIKKLFDGLTISFDVVFVEDGGQDSSWKVLLSLKEKYPEIITAVKLNKNYGQHNATICGFGFTKGKQVITMDDDLQNPPEEIVKLIDRMNESDADVVYGIYDKKKHSAVRNMGSASVKKTSKVLLKGTGKGSSFRLIKKEIIDKLTEHYHHFVFIDEVLLWYTEDISFVFVDHHIRKSGKSGYSGKRLFKMISDLVFFYTNLPLKIMVYSGLIVSVITFVFGIQFIIKRLFFDVPLGYTSLIVTVLFSTSLIVFSLGVIGGYLSRIYMVQNRKPGFTVKKVL